MRGRGGESGQATVEWVGLVLGMALVFVALLAGGREAAKGESGRELGEAVAERITCTVRGECGGAGGPGGALRDRGGALREPGAGGGTLRDPRSALGAAPAPVGNPPGGRLSVPSPGKARSKLRGALRALGWPKRFVKRTWFPCLGLRGWQYDREHPRLLGERLPTRDLIDRLNECANPLSFLFGG